MIRLAAIVTRVRPEPSIQERAFWALVEREHVHTYLATGTPGTFACSRSGCSKTVRRIPG